MTDSPTVNLASPRNISPLGSLLQWCHEGARTCVFQAPRWTGLQTNAVLMAGIVLISLLLALILERLYIIGAATFYWQAVTGGWIGTALSAWVCYLVRTGDPANARLNAAPSAAHLFTMLLAQAMSMTIGFGVFFVVLVRAGIYTEEAVGAWGIWVLWLAPMIWLVLAQIVLLWRGGDQRRRPMAIAILTLILSAALLSVASPAEFWYPDTSDDTEKSQKRLRLTQQLMEAQPKLLARRLEEVRPQRPENIDLYAITFAPYAGSVFRKESEVVAQVMARRFNAEGRLLQLINNTETTETWPWATSLNLQRAIQRFAQVMDRDEDILFIHLTSHGARDGELSASFWPMELDQLRPSDLKQWLDEAGIRNRVISVSACYSGSWIDPLADENTLVMTAADAQHTSYGCGSKSELTFFGRAMYDEQLRNNTLSFEEAHKAAWKVIQKREQEAGKDDGFSNPQIRVGSKIRHRLAAMQQGLAGVESQRGMK
jgi:hypothetical protein